MDADGSYSEDHGYRVCFWLQFLCTLEAFVGVVFSSICGALIFAKVVRIQALAPVLFSDPMIVRYGPGVQKAFCKDCPSGKIPCPVLSFRLANVYTNRQGGELIDTKLKLKAIFHNGKGDLNLEEGDSKSSEHMILDENPNNYEEEEDDISICMVKQSSVIIEEDPGSNFDVQRTFLSIDVDSAENPYFKRIWTVNHVLDQKSPLIVPHVQRRILENQGYWPAYLNDAESVRASINFDQIFVELDGISVVSADKVYAQHMYNYTDMNIGFEFMPVLYRSARKGLNIRYDMLGDVTEQKGGGSEDFVPDDDPRELGAMRNFSGNLQIMKLDD